MTTASPMTTGADARLDKRRAKWLATQQSATQAEDALAALDQKLAAVAAKREADKAALKAAIDRQAELEKELKALAKQRERLRADRQRAQRSLKKARRRAKVTEAKFDRALLADMVRKAKTADLSRNTTAPKVKNTVTSTVPANGTPRRQPAAPGRRRSVSSTPSPRRATAGTNGRRTAS